MKLPQKSKGFPAENVSGFSVYFSHAEGEIGRVASRLFTVQK